MAQAGVDLPKSKPSSTPLNSADDLLSQLAGEEIDRMLADADSGHKPDEQNYAPPPGATDEPETQSAAPAVEELLPPEADAAEDSASPEQPAQDAFSAGVDELFRQLEEEEPANAEPPEIEAANARDAAKLQEAIFATDPAPPAAAAPAVTVASVTTSEPKTENTEEEESTSAAERAALQEPVASTAPLAPTSPAELVSLQAVLENSETVHVLPQERVAIYVRALELINGPFADCPAVVRDTLGKIAILTMVNAIGVLIYLLMFRK